MTTKAGQSRNYYSREILAVILFLFFGSALTFGQKKMSFLTDTKYETEWWFPLTKKHNIDPNQFTFGSNIKPESNDPTGYIVLELGKGAFLNDAILTIKDPLLIIKETEETYTIITAKSANHELENSLINCENGKIEEYKYKSTELMSTKSHSFGELKLDLKTRQVLIKFVTSRVHK